MMNREEKAFLANIATILVKDIAIDRNFQPKKFPNILCPKHYWKDDEELDVFVYKMQKKMKHKRNMLKTKLQKKFINRMFNIIIKLPSTFSDDEFESTYHITRNTYEALCKEFYAYMPNNIKIGGCFISQNVILCLGLIFLLFETNILQNLLKTHQINLNLCNKIVPLFNKNITSNVKSYVNWPKVIEEQNTTLKEFSQINKDKQLKGVFGIIASKVIDINFESTETKECTPIVLQMVCNVNQIILNMEIIDANTYKCEETDIGKCILNDETNICIPKDCYLIGDNGFPLGIKLITPFREASNENKEMFNTILNSYINISEIVFQKFFHRFSILSKFKIKDMHELKNIIKAMCVVHNLCILNKDSSELGEQKINVDKLDLEDNENDMPGLIKRQTILDTII